jgi:uncharacterized protein YbbC (DUF1343 family)
MNTHNFASAKRPFSGLLAGILVISSLRFAIAEEQKPTLLGIDVLEARGFDALVGKQIGLITNQTGVNSKGESTADVLARAPKVRLVALFSPEHGIRGTIEHGRDVSDGIDTRTQLPVYSLYGKTQRPTPEMLNAIDAMVFDMQDVGSRYYTYLATMAMAMEEASKRGIEFIVLDRPNPLGGAVVEGPVADPSVKHITAYFSVPIRHGFTAGELAQWYNETAQVKAKVKVVPMLGWNRKYLWRDTQLNFVAPSPNIQTPEQALLYAGTGMFEATNLSVGRGTGQPFHLIGAPWIKGKNFFRRLSTESLPGLRVKRTSFIPSKELYEGEICNGVMIEITDPEAVRPVEAFVQIALVLRELYPSDFQLRWPEVARMTGTTDFEKLYTGKQSAQQIKDLFNQSAAKFVAERDKYLIY